MQAFYKWFTDNGGFYDGVSVAQNSQGFRGLMTTKEIPANKVIIAVPNKLAVTIQMIKKTPLNDIIKANSDLYDQDENEEANMNILALWVYFEKAKGEKSFYHPFFAIVEQSTSILDWSLNELQLFKDEYLIEHARCFQESMEDHWNLVQTATQKLLKPNKQLYYWSYTFTMTRQFGWEIPYNLLLPLADFQNHNEEPSKCTDVFYFQRQFEEVPMSAPPEYKIKHTSLDVSIVKTFGRPYQQKELQEIYIQAKQEEESDDQEDNDTDDGWEYEYEDEQNQEKKSFVSKFKQNFGQVVKEDVPEKKQKEKIKPEKKWPWYNYKDSDAYFLIAAQKTLCVNEEVLCCYGRRTSRYLLLWYGFCKLNNKYDSHPFKLWIHKRQLGKDSIYFGYVGNDEKYVTLKDFTKLETKMLSQQFRLKKNSLNEELAIYIRNILQENKRIMMVALPSDFDFEEQMLNEMLKLAQYLFEDLKDVEYNPEILKNLEFKQKMAMIYRMNHYEIMLNQVKMIKLAIKIVNKLKSGCNLNEILDIEKASNPVLLGYLDDYIRQLQVGILDKLVQKYEQINTKINC